MIGSLLAEIVPTWAISSFFETGREILVVSSSTAASTAFSIPRRTAVGLAPEVTIRRPFAEDGAGQDGRGGGAVAGGVGRLRRHDVDELGAHVLERVGQLDLLGDRDAVLGDGRAAERLAEDHVTPGRAERGAHGVGQDVDAFEHLPAGGVGEKQLLGHGVGSYVGSGHQLRRAEWLVVSG